MYKVILTPEATEHTDKIVSFYMNDLESPTALKKILAFFRTFYQNIAIFPLMYPVSSEGIHADPNERKAIVSKYTIIYYVDEENKTVFIQGIYRGRTNLGYYT